MEIILNNLKEALINLLPFIFAIIGLVIANSIGGIIKNYKSFSWKKLLLGALKWLGILLMIVCMLMSVTIYEPLAEKYATELDTLELALAVAYFVKVCVLVYEITQVKKSSTLETEEEHSDQLEDSEAIG